MFDAIVVGARVCGASTAMLLARKGWRVHLIDRASFPSETMSSLYIHQAGTSRLARWGLLDQIKASGCPHLDRISYTVGDVSLEASADGAYAPRRKILDQLLIDAAIAAGADFAANRRVTGLLEDDGRVAGVRMRDSHGRESSLRARLVVGADGMRSAVARLAGAPVIRHDPLLSCVYYTTWHDVPAHFSVFEQTGSWVAVIPTHDETTVVATYLPQQHFAHARRDPLSAHLDAVKNTSPELFDRLQAGQRHGKLYGSGDQQNFFRAPAGDGWVLAGDASHHKDSISARGITDAFIHAELLAGALPADAADRQSVHLGLGVYAKRRDETFAEPYQNALSLAQLQISPSRLELMRAVSASPDLTQRFFSVMSGVIGIEELFTPELLDLLG